MEGDQGGLHTRRASEAEAAVCSMWARGGSGSLASYSSHFRTLEGVVPFLELLVTALLPRFLSL